MAKNYEIRVIDGQKVFVKNIVDNFWLFNDVYVHFCDDFKVTDDVISHMLGKKDDEFFPYHGASGGNILVQWKCPDGYAFGEYRLLDCRDDGIRKKAEEVYDEYKSWAGVF